MENGRHYTYTYIETLSKVYAADNISSHIDLYCNCDESRPKRDRTGILSTITGGASVGPEGERDTKDQGFGSQDDVDVVPHGRWSGPGRRDQRKVSSGR